MMNLGGTAAGGGGDGVHEGQQLEMRILNYLFETSSTSGEKDNMFLETSTTRDSNNVEDTKEHYEDGDGIVGMIHTLDASAMNSSYDKNPNKRRDRLFSDDEMMECASPRQKLKTDNDFPINDDFMSLIRDEVVDSFGFDSKVPPMPIKNNRRRTSPPKSSRKSLLTKEFERLEKSQIAARTEVRTIKPRNPNEIVRKKKRRSHFRGSYTCKLCGLPKKNHVCAFAPKAKPRKPLRVKKYVSIGTQCEIDSDMTIVAMKAEEREESSSDNVSSSPGLVRAMKGAHLVCSFQDVV